MINPKISIRKKEGLPQAPMKIIFLGKLAEYQEYIQVYTDGSKTETKCSCAVVIPSQSLSLSYRLPPPQPDNFLCRAYGNQVFTSSHIKPNIEQTSEVYFPHWFTFSSGLPLTPATSSKKCCHWDWKFGYSTCKKGYICPIHMGSSTLWYNRKRISRSGCKTSLPTKPDHSSPYYRS